MTPRFASVIAAAMLGMASPALSSTIQHIRFTTYMRQGPDRSYRVIDEVQTGQDVSVQNCANGWCRVRYGVADGYVAQTALASAARIPAASENCMIAAQSGYHGRDDIQVCARAAGKH